MKKIVIMSLLFGFTFMLNSCKKSEEYKNISLSQTLNQNQSFIFDLPGTDDGYEIVADAKHAKVSLIGKNANGTQTYSYTPFDYYTGTDQIVLKTMDNNHDNNKNDNMVDYYIGNPSLAKGKGKKGNSPRCGMDERMEDDYIVTINITILPIPAAN